MLSTKVINDLRCEMANLKKSEEFKYNTESCSSPCASQKCPVTSCPGCTRLVCFSKGSGGGKGGGEGGGKGEGRGEEGMQAFDLCEEFFILILHPRAQDIALIRSNSSLRII